MEMLLLLTVVLLVIWWVYRGVEGKSRTDVGKDVKETEKEVIQKAEESSTVPSRTGKQAFWLHVNHPNDKAIIHIEGGCYWVNRAVGRKLQGMPYGPIRGDENGYWEGPFPDLESAKKAQMATGKSLQSLCKICFQNKESLISS